MVSWKMGEAKSHFSDLISQSNAEPQIITDRNNQVAAVIGIEQYNRLTELEKNYCLKQTASDLFSQLKEIQAIEPIELEIPERIDRTTDFSGIAE